MLDVHLLRAHPQLLDEALKRRGSAPESEKLITLDNHWRAIVQEKNELLALHNTKTAQAGAAKRSGDSQLFDALVQEAEMRKTQIAELEIREKTARDARDALLLTLPNIPLDNVPQGTDERDNVELYKKGIVPTFSFIPKEHFDIPAAQSGLDFKTAAKLSGTRFVLLKGAMARLHRAIAQFMLDIHTTEHGMMEVNTPVLVRDDAMIGTNQLPKFANDSYQTTNGWWLIPTSEVTLTNTVAGDILDEESLPLRLTAHTLCFRSEAGSAGKDTTGMLRQHQFEKVEMVSIVHPDESLAEHARMTKCAETILDLLKLPYRTVLLCTGDMGFGAQKTHDIEVWLPGQNTYREISSVSLCGDFQARRMNARFKPKTGGKTAFVHTLNGSGLAVGRTLIAVLENGQQPDGSVRIPVALHSYMKGKTLITPNGDLV